MREYLVKATFIRGNALQRYILRSYQTTHSVLTRHVVLSSLTTIILPSVTRRRAGSQPARGEPKDLEPLTLNPEPTIIPVSHTSDS